MGIPWSEWKKQYLNWNYYPFTDADNAIVECPLLNCPTKKGKPCEVCGSKLQQGVLTKGQVKRRGAMNFEMMNFVRQNTMSRRCKRTKICKRKGLRPIGSRCKKHIGGITPHACLALIIPERTAPVRITARRRLSNRESPESGTATFRRVLRQARGY